MNKKSKEGKKGKKNAKNRFLIPEDEKKTFGEGMNFAASEAFRLLRTNLLFALPFSSLRDGETCRVVGITSSMSGEGKSTTALNLGYVLAESGKRVLVVEADMRLPTISKRLRLEQEAGLSSLLAGLCGAQEAIQPSGIQERLWVMNAGPVPPNPSELLGSERMKSVLKGVSVDYDFIILDLPPVNEVSDALVASRLVHGMIMVVRKGYATQSSVGEAMRQMGNVGVKVLGFVMTYSNGQGGKYKSYYNKPGYGYTKARKGTDEAQKSPARVPQNLAEIQKKTVENQESSDKTQKGADEAQKSPAKDQKGTNEAQEKMAKDQREQMKPKRVRLESPKTRPRSKRKPLRIKKVPPKPKRKQMRPKRVQPKIKRGRMKLRREWLRIKRSQPND